MLSLALADVARWPAFEHLLLLDRGLDRREAGVRDEPEESPDSGRVEGKILPRALGEPQKLNALLPYLRLVRIPYVDPNVCRRVGRRRPRRFVSGTACLRRWQLVARPI